MGYTGALGSASLEDSVNRVGSFNAASRLSAACGFKYPSSVRIYRGGRSLVKQRFDRELKIVSVDA